MMWAEKGPPGKPAWLRKRWPGRPWRFEIERKGERSVCYNFDLGNPTRTPRQDDEAIRWIDLCGTMDDRGEGLREKGWDA